MPTLKGLFGSSVRAHRVAKGLSQPELADAAYISEAWLRRIELGQASPSFDTIEALCIALGVSAPELFGGRPATDARAADAYAELVSLVGGRSASELRRLARMIEAMDEGA